MSRDEGLIRHETKIDYIIAALPPNPGSGGTAGFGDTYTETTPEVTQATAGEPTATPVSTQPPSSLRPRNRPYRHRQALKKQMPCRPPPRPSSTHRCF